MATPTYTSSVYATPAPTWTPPPPPPVAPAPASPTYSPPPTVRAPWGTDWDAVGAAFTRGLTQGTAWGAGPASPSSWFTAPPSYLQAYTEQVTAGAKSALDAQRDLAATNAKAAQAIIAASRGTMDILGRPFPVVVDPGSPAFRLQLPAPSAGAAASQRRLWVYAVAAGGILLAWRLVRRGRARPPTGG